ncbi:MAG: ISKra4 family transposase [Nocardioidaceae bacterium]
MEAFTVSRACFEQLLGWLEGSEAAALSHGELEDELDRRGRELLRQMLQGQLDLRALREQRAVQVTDAEGERHGVVEAGHVRGLASVFGAVSVTRLAYRHHGHANLYAVDGQLNLPTERHSHGLRRLAAVESARGSFDDATEAIRAGTGQHVGKRQVEALATRAAADVEEFYTTRQPVSVEAGDALVLSADGKGIVMRPEALRPVTARKANRASGKLKTRLSKGEKPNRKRLAEVGAVYDVTPACRSAVDVLASHSTEQPPAAAPRATNKSLTASVVDDAAEVLAAVFGEAERRDPGHQRRWVALVDGNNHQIERIEAEAAARDIDVTVLVDLVHVLEYLWAAAWSFFTEADPAAEAWVRDRALAILNGDAPKVTAGIRRRATTMRLDRNKRVKADACAKYLQNKASYLDYPTALSAGWPIATGVIEGACRHPVKDRMDITGARWGSTGAEAVLKLRAVRANHDFDQYWRYHLHREHERNHTTRYASSAIPAAA